MNLLANTQRNGIIVVGRFGSSDHPSSMIRRDALSEEKLTTDLFW